MGDGLLISFEEEKNYQKNSLKFRASIKLRAKVRDKKARSSDMLV